MRRSVTILALLPSLWFGQAGAAQWSGSVALEYRDFFQAPLDGRQHDGNLSLALDQEYYRDWNDGDQSLTIAPYVRLDQHDEERTHVDFRELTWLKAADDWELRLGIRKVFWGVTESQHLVDIINQTDLVESPDGEEKLGQPMVNLALIRDWGTVDLFVLPWFRERTFPGVEGRLRSLPRVAADQAIYESSREERHIDYAARWKHSTGIWDMGLSYFTGTSRDPAFTPGVESGEAVLVPVYNIIHQTGVDVQATLDNWLWKLEMIRRSSQGEIYGAATGGFEYTFYGVFGSIADVGLVMEYLYDDRKDAASTPFEDDVMMGLRLVMNDAQGTEALLGSIMDRDGDGIAYSLEASRRLGDSWKLSVEARAYADTTPGDLLHVFEREDYLELGLAYYY